MAAKKRPTPKKPVKKAATRSARKRSPKPIEAKPAALLHVEPMADHPAARPMSPPPVKRAVLLPNGDVVIPEPEVESVEALPLEQAWHEGLLDVGRLLVPLPRNRWQRFKDWLFMVPVERT